MLMLIGFLGTGFILSTGIVISLIVMIVRKNRLSDPTPCQIMAETPFSVARYLERVEQAQIDILDSQEPVDQTIILWWGLDGLRLDENGDLKWISRKKKAPDPPVYQYTPCSFQNTAQTYQNTAQLQNQINYLQTQQIQQSQNQALLQMLSMQQCCARPGYVCGSSFLYPTYPDFYNSLCNTTFPINIR